MHDELLVHALSNPGKPWLAAINFDQQVFQENEMKQKAALLTAILALVTAPVAGAEESGADKPAAGHSEEKTGAPAEGHKVDFKELFGCEPMGEEGHMPMPKPASGVDQQRQPAQQQE